MGVLEPTLYRRKKKYAGRGGGFDGCIEIRCAAECLSGRSLCRLDFVVGIELSSVVGITAVLQSGAFERSFAVGRRQFL